MGNMSMDRMGSSFDRMGMSGMDMNRSFGGYGHMGGNMSDRSSGSKAGCQIFVRNVSLCKMTALRIFCILNGISHLVRLSSNKCIPFVLQLSYDLTWQKLKEKFGHCGMSSVNITGIL